MAHERTLARDATVEGIGIHSGRNVRLRLLPAAPGLGLVFHRSDVDGWVAARAENLRNHAFATTLGVGGCEIGTVEHLLAALYGTGITNTVIELDGPEVPILDGSARPYVDLILAAGVDEQGGSIPEIVVKDSLRIQDEGRWIEVHPGSGLRVDYRLRFDAPAIGWQRFEGGLDAARFATAIAPARTFGLLSQGPELRRQGLGLGATLDNCVVVDGRRVLSGPLRFTNEFVRHKVLDLIGDLALLEYPIRGTVIAHRAGHALHVALVRGLLAAPELWELAEPERATPFTVRPLQNDLNTGFEAVS